jgi:multiple sugar transport system permease protein
VGVLAVFCLAPVAWTALTSVKPEAEVFASPPAYVPSRVTLDSYVGVFEQRPFARYLLNSVLVAALSTAMALAAGAPAAYALARFRLRGARLMEQAILVFALFPPAVLLAPLYGAARSLGLMNSHIGLAVVHAALNLPLVLWMLVAFFRRLPPDLEDAASVDGFTRLQFLWRVVLPLSGPAVAAAAILAFIFSWNEFVIALALITRDDLRTVPVGISMLSGVSQEDLPWGQICAAVMMSTLPVVAAVLTFQRRIVGGLTAGAVKG